MLKRFAYSASIEISHAPEAVIEFSEEGIFSIGFLQNHGAKRWCQCERNNA